MFTTLRSRLWLTYAILVGVVLFIVLGSLAFYVARSNFLAKVQLTTVAARFLQKQDFLILKRGQSDEVALRIDDSLGMRVIILGAEGDVLVDSRSDTEGEPPKLKIPPPEQFRQVLTFEDGDGQEWLYIGRRLADKHILVIAVPRQPIREVIASPIIREMAGDMFWAGVITLLLSILSAYLISRWVAAPLQKMAVATQAMAEGQRTEVDLKGPKEVQILGQAFNMMTQRVHDSQQSQRDFVANVSHELKTPLTSIQGFAQAILDGTASTAEARSQAAEVIYDESSRMHRMVLDLLDLARLDAGTADLERAPFNLEALLKSVAERFTPQSREAGVKLVTEIRPLPGFIGDGDRLSQVFTNLVDNALKHTPPGGTVKLNARDEGGWVEVSVADSGPGIPPEELSRIFERFYQLDKARKGGPGRGVGLGLAIAREIIQAHSGTISAQSRIGKGSLFVIRLPTAQPDDSTLVSRK